MKKFVVMGLWCLGIGIVMFGFGNCIWFNIVYKFVYVLFYVREDYIFFLFSGRVLGNVINKFELKYGLFEVVDVSYWCNLYEN